MKAIWRRMALAASACSVIGFNPLFASDTSELREQVWDLKAKVAALESTRGASAGGETGGGECGTLTTLKQKGSMMIGGDVNVDILVRHRDDSTSSSDSVDSTTFTTESANLRLKVDASPDSFLYIKLDLDDLQDGTANQDDLLEECRFVWSHVRASNWGLSFGKGEVPYGQDRTLGVLQSYHHNSGNNSGEGPTFILAGTEGALTPADPQNPHADVGMVTHPGEVDNAYMIEGNYLYKDFLKFELALFQNPGARGMQEDRSADNLNFQSWSARIWLMPTEGLRLQGSVIALTDRFTGDVTTSGRFACETSYAISLGFDYKVPNYPLEVFGEYQHSWDWNYTEGFNTNTYQLGLVWNTTSQIDLGIMGELLNLEDDRNNIDDTYSRMVLSGKYTLENGIFMILEYGHEWFVRAASGSNDRHRDGDLLAFRMGWAF